MENRDFFKMFTLAEGPKLAFIDTLLNEKSCGTIVKKVAFLDDHLLQVVLQAYRPKGGSPKFTKSKIEKMTLEKKIMAIASLPVGSTTAVLRDQAVAKLRAMRTIRNKAAHAAKLTRVEAEKLYADPENRRLLANFPDDFKAECAAVQQLLHDLLQRPEFSDDE